MVLNVVFPLIVKNVGNSGCSTMIELYLRTYAIIAVFLAIAYSTKDIFSGEIWFSLLVLFVAHSQWRWINEN